MKFKSALFVFCFLFCVFCAPAQNPSFRSFRLTDFNTNSYTISLSSNVWWHLTNSVGGGSATNAISDTNGFGYGTTTVQQLVATQVVANTFIGDAAGLTNVGPWYNIRDFGAVGGNIAADSVGISNAIYLANTLGGTVYFPCPAVDGAQYMDTNIYAGSMRIDGRKVTFRGENPRCSFWNLRQDSYPVSISLYAKAPIIKNLTFIGRGIDHANTHAETTNTSCLVAESILETFDFQNVRIFGFSGAGIDLYAASGGTFTQLECETNGIGLRISGYMDGTKVGGWFAYNDIGIMVGGDFAKSVPLYGATIAANPEFSGGINRSIGTAIHYTGRENRIGVAVVAAHALRIEGVNEFGGVPIQLGTDGSALFSQFITDAPNWIASIKIQNYETLSTTTGTNILVCTNVYGLSLDTVTTAGSTNALVEVSSAFTPSVNFEPKFLNCGQTGPLLKLGANYYFGDVGSGFGYGRDLEFSRGGKQFFDTDISTTVPIMTFSPSAGVALGLTNGGVTIATGNILTYSGYAEVGGTISTKAADGAIGVYFRNDLTRYAAHIARDDAPWRLFDSGVSTAVPLVQIDVSNGVTFQSTNHWGVGDLGTSYNPWNVFASNIVLVTNGKIYGDGSGLTNIAGGGGGGPLSGGFTNGSAQITADGHNMVLVDPNTGWTNLNWTDQTLSSANSLVLDWFNKWLIGTWTANGQLFTNLQAAKINWPTNLGSVSVPDLSKNYASIATNNAVEFTGVTGIDLSGTNVNWTLLRLTNTSGSAKPVIIPVEWIDSLTGVGGAAPYYMTNAASISIWHSVYDGTNFTFRGGTQYPQTGGGGGSVADSRVVIECAADGTNYNWDALLYNEAYVLLTNNGILNITALPTNNTPSKKLFVQRTRTNLGQLFSTNSNLRFGQDIQAINVGPNTNSAAWVGFTYNWLSNRVDVTGNTTGY